MVTGGIVPPLVLVPRGSSHRRAAPKKRLLEVLYDHPHPPLRLVSLPCRVQQA